jgi:hypothetical protein
MRTIVVALVCGISVWLPALALAQTRAASEGTRVQDANADAAGGTTAAVTTAGVPDGIARVGGMLVYVKTGRATQIVGAQRFAEGVTVQRNGDIILSDGRKVKLTDGRMVTFAGELREAPRNIELPKPIGAPGGNRASAPRSTD